MAKFVAKIKLKRSGPLTCQIRGRSFERGKTVVTTTDPAEAAYFKTVGGFSVDIMKGKLLPATAKKKAREEEELEERDDEDEEESEEDEEEERDEEVEGGYEAADLKKLDKKELFALIDDDEDLELSSSDFKKRAGAKEIIKQILEVQGSEDEED